MSIRHSTTDLQQRRLSGETLTGAILTEADLREADLARADLTGALLLETHFEGADLTGCFIYGISAWNPAIPADGPIASDISFKE
jgi:uncharacterized protein YjbI with pentapeptide repeats